MITLIKGDKCVGELATNQGLKEMAIFADSSLGDDFSDLKSFLEEWGTEDPQSVAKQALLAAQRASGDNKSTLIRTAQVMKRLNGTVTISAS